MPAGFDLWGREPELWGPGHAEPLDPWPRRAVVTGGAGFLGSHLCQALLEGGSDVVCLDNFVTGSPVNLETVASMARFRSVKCDITGYVHVPGPVDLVLHMACPASPVDYLRMPVQTLEVGALGTQHALDLALDKNARFILASTSEVYGDPQVHPQPEGYWGNVNPVGPRSVYDEAKRYAEALTTAYRNTYRLDTGIVRIFNTYGPRMRPYDGRAIPTFIRQAITGQPLTVTGDGMQTRSVCYVDDLVDGVLALARSRHPGPVNLGNPDELSVLQIAEDVLAATESSSPSECVARPVDDPQVRRPDTTLARHLLGWQPTVGWPEGLAATVSWFQSLAGTPPKNRYGAIDAMPVWDSHRAGTANA
ncbi:MAG: NAD-dependent epimerase/dehydratase family protein [Actinomycetes bacterium]